MAMLSKEEWLRYVCVQLGKQWTDLPAAREISKNHDLYGAYVEGSVRQFISRFVSPLRSSNGSIVHEDNFGDSPQLDAIIWHPSPLPPILEVGEFAIVPRTAGLAYLEIKASNYNGAVGKDIEEKLSMVNTLVPMEDLQPLDRVLPWFCSANHESERALGVVCVHTPGRKDEVLDRLIDEDRVVVMVRRTKKKKDNKTTYELKVDESGIVRLAKFLVHIRFRAKALDGVYTMRDPDDLIGIDSGDNTVSIPSGWGDGPGGER